MLPTRPQVLTALADAARASGQAALCVFEGVHLKVVVRGGRLLVGVWVEDGGRLGALECEEIGEDAGFIDPVVRPFAFQEWERAHLIAEGYAGALCAHELPPPIHVDGQREFGEHWRCERCGVTLLMVQARRGRRQVWSYDRWQVRPHVFQAWAKRGPPPGALQARAHHGKGGA